MDSPMRRHVGGGSELPRPREGDGKSKFSVAGKVNGSIPWQQSDLVWLAIHPKPCPGVRATPIHGRRVETRTSPRTGWNPARD